MRVFLSLVTGGVLMGCNQSSSTSPRLSGIDQAITCPTINGVEAVLSDDGPEIIILGEPHGMVEPPAFVEALVCQSLAKGHRTALALEISDEKGLFEAYLHSNGDDDAKSYLFEDWMWKGEFTDGRSSEAMLELVDYAREMSQTKNLKVIKFKADDLDAKKFSSKNPDTGADDFDQNGYVTAYEKEMAENILKEAAALNIDKTIVLVGGVHARRSNVSFGELDYPAMAVHMPAPQSLTFNTINTGGTSWNCRGPKPSDCGKSQTVASISSESKIAKSDDFEIILGLGRKTIPHVSESRYKAEWYDGVVYMGAASASPPANILGRKPYDETETD